MDYQRLIDWVDDHIVNHSGQVILAFLLVTAVFGAGLANVSTESGTQQFAEDIPANNALEAINDEFGSSFAADTGSTQLIQRGENVLTRQQMLYMLRAQKRLEDKEDLRVTSTSSAASIIAQTIDPSATTVEKQIFVMEHATPSEVQRAVRQSASNPAFIGTVSNDFNKRGATASATIAVVTHEVPGAGGSGSAGQSGSSPLTDIQQRSQRVVDTVGGDITVFGSGIISAEFGTVITDSLLIVTPAAVILILFFLVYSYRDLLDLLLGAFALFMAVIWTFGFLGLAGIPFSQMMIAVPPLLLAVGIDFGIHAINRYREDKQEGLGVDDAMRRATDQLLVAFFIVTGTTVIGFLANLASDLAPIKDFGVVSAVGITFTFLIFGIFLPAAKVWLEHHKDHIPIPTFSQAPLGQEDSRLGGVLRGGVVIAKYTPVLFLLVALVASAGAGWYAKDVDTSFSQEDFLPPEHVPGYLQALPEPFAPSDYSVVSQLNYLEDKFATTQGGSATVYYETRMERDTVLESIYRAGEDPPDSFVSSNRHADSQSIVTVIQSYQKQDPEFRQLVARNDRDGNGIPDQNLGQIYDYLLDSPARDQALNYISEDRRSTRVVYSVKADASQTEVTNDAKAVAKRFRGDATATGSTVVFKAVSDLIFNSALISLAIALGVTVIFLIIVYWVLEGYPSLGIANTVPIAVTVAFVAATMRFLGISFNAFTATILSLTIGLGIDYSVHVVHRFIDERREYDLFTALNRTVIGTGGALFSSMLTTTFGIGVLMLSVLSILGQFGLLTAMSISYSFVASLLILPSTLVVWDRFVNDDADTPMGHPDESPGARVVSGTPEGGDR